MIVFGWILYDGFKNREEWFEEGEEDKAWSARVRNVMNGVKGVILVILAQAILNPYIDKIFSPHKRTWRFIAMVCSIYLYFLVFMFF